LDGGPKLAEGLLLILPLFSEAKPVFDMRTSAMRTGVVLVCNNVLISL
jgi:hypothetical protein